MIPAISFIYKAFRVAPLVGAWIEIRSTASSVVSSLVAPLVGAWIEIMISKHFCISSRSLLSWERGLK